MKFFIMLSMMLFSNLIFAENILQNGDFEDTNNVWNFYYLNGSGAHGTTIIEADPQNSSNHYLKANVATLGSENWHAQVQAPKWECEDNVQYILTFKAKGEYPVHVAINYGPDDDYGYKEGSTINLTPEWKTYTYSFMSDRAGIGKLNINFYLGDNVGDYYFDDVVLEKNDFKQTNFYKDANKRIEAIRKNKINITVKDENKIALPNIKVKIEEIEPLFKWGTCLSFSNSLTSNEEWYRAEAAKYFQCAVFENDFKWPSYEPSQNQVNSDKINTYLDWGEQNNIEFRGHALEWGIDKYGYDQFWPRLQDSAFYAKALKNRIYRELTTYKGKIKEYDVYNEVFHEVALFNKFGKSLLDSAYIWARKADPSAKLFLNEYSVIAGGQTDTYMGIIQNFIDKKIPLDGIGVQSHFSGNINPDDALLKLDKLSKFGLPIKVTEFDINVGNTNMTEQEQADNFAKFMRAAFSHPSVKGFLFWGFWDSKHWISHGGFFNADKTPKIAADTVYNLIHKKWWTNETLTSNMDGKIETKGFYGKYKATVYFSANDSATYLFDLPESKSVNIEFIKNQNPNYDATSIQSLIFKKEGYNITVSPNPSINKKINVKIDVPQKGNYCLKIYSANGQILNKKNLQFNNNALLSKNIKVTVKCKDIYYIVLTDIKNKALAKISGTLI